MWSKMHLLQQHVSCADLAIAQFQQGQIATGGLTCSNLRSKSILACEHPSWFTLSSKALCISLGGGACIGKSKILSLSGQILKVYQNTKTLFLFNLYLFLTKFFEVPPPKKEKKTYTIFGQGTILASDFWVAFKKTYFTNFPKLHSEVYLKTEIICCKEHSVWREMGVMRP